MPFSISNKKAEPELVQLSVCNSLKTWLLPPTEPSDTRWIPPRVLLLMQLLVANH
jgi:hypothetical protein